MAEVLDRFGTEVLAGCLMTNHTHLIAVPKDSKVLARAIGVAHRRYAYPYEFLDATMRRLGSRQDESEQMIERLTGRDLAVRKAGRRLKRAS
jgi:REP element-mobilizing transposase RayT